MLIQPAVAALNHLLIQSGWALQRLAQFSGKTARFDIAPFSFAFTVLPDGSLSAATPDASADAYCVIAPTLLPRLALHDEKAHSEITRSGDAALLTEIFYLSRHLRWDAAEDLSRVTGDIVAERIVHAVKSSQQRVRDTALNLSQALTEYWTEEHLLLAKPTQVAAFMQQVDKLRDDVARLEQRLYKLTRL